MLQIQKSLADPASAYQQQTSAAVASSNLQEKYLKGLHDAHKPDAAVISDDRAQYKQTLGNFLAREAKGKKKGSANDYSDETDSAEDAAYAKKITGKASSDEKQKIQKKLKIFDDDDCEGDGDGSDDDSGDDDESYEDQVDDDDDDSDENDDLMSSGEDNGSSGGKKKASQPEDKKM